MSEAREQVSTEGTATVEPAAVEPAVPAPATPEAPSSLLSGEKPVTLEAPAEPVVLYDPAKLAVPEGVTLDEGVRQRFDEIVKGVPHETAQGLFNLYREVSEAEVEKTYQAWKTTRDAWVTSVKAHPEIGGDKLEGVVRTIGQVFDDPTLADPGVREGLGVTGAGDNLAVIRTFYLMAKHLVEGGMVAGHAPIKAAPKTLAQAIFPNNPSEAESM